MKIALAQMRVIPGKPKKNLETMLRMINEAKSKNVDIIAFPEMCVGGYLLGDEWLDDDVCMNLMHYNDIIREATENITVVYGNIFLDKEINERVKDDNYHPNKDGRTRKYNAIYAFSNKQAVKRIKENSILPLGVQPKTLLPNYRFFDDERYFFSLEDIAKDFGVELKELTQPFLFNIKNKQIPIGLELCEDLWCYDYRKDGKTLNPTKLLIENGAEFIINISASPWTYGKNNARDRRIKFLKEELNNGFVPFLYVNCTGAQNNGKNIITFDGGSTVYNSDGLPIVFSKNPYEEELIIADDDFSKKPIERIEKSKIAQKYDALIQGIKYIKDMVGLENDPKFVVGMSGGVDSSVVASLLVRAFGRERVLGINMPTKYNTSKTRQVAEYVASQLGIAYVIDSIEDIVNATEENLEKIKVYDESFKLSELNKENIQAKIRGTDILSNFAAMHNALFTNNGNKDEIALGYATLYGDWGGAVSILGDLTKAEVFELAKYINEIYKKEIIPEILIPDNLFRFSKNQIEPSAELKHNQVDPIKFGYHCALIEHAITDYKKKTTPEIMRWYLDGELEKNLNITYELLERYNLQNPKTFVDDLEDFYSKIKKAVFKRVQSPPIIMTSKSAYGYDIRESILPYENTIEHERLKKKILQMKTYKTRMGKKD